MIGVAENTKKQPRGKPFPKGKSGNPGGRPKRSQEEINLMEACKRKTPEALEVVLDIMANGLSERVRLQAAAFVIERGWGKAPLRIEHEPAEIIISRKLDPQEAYLKMLEGGRLEALPGECESA